MLHLLHALNLVEGLPAAGRLIRLDGPATDACRGPDRATQTVSVSVTTGFRSRSRHSATLQLIGKWQATETVCILAGT